MSTKCLLMRFKYIVHLRFLAESNNDNSDDKGRFSHILNILLQENHEGVKALLKDQLEKKT